MIMKNQITQKEFDKLVREAISDTKYSCPQTAFFSAQSRVLRRLKEDGVEVSNLKTY